MIVRDELMLGAAMHRGSIHAGQTCMHKHFKAEKHQTSVKYTFSWTS